MVDGSCKNHVTFALRLQFLYLAGRTGTLKHAKSLFLWHVSYSFESNSTSKIQQNKFSCDHGVSIHVLLCLLKKKLGQPLLIFFDIEMY